MRLSENLDQAFQNRDFRDVRESPIFITQGLYVYKDTCFNRVWIWIASCFSSSYSRSVEKTAEKIHLLFESKLTTDFFTAKPLRSLNNLSWIVEKFSKTSNNELNQKVEKACLKAAAEILGESPRKDKPQNPEKIPTSPVKGQTVSAQKPAFITKTHIALALGAYYFRSRSWACHLMGEMLAGSLSASLIALNQTSPLNQKAATGSPLRAGFFAAKAASSLALTYFATKQLSNISADLGAKGFIMNFASGIALNALAKAVMPTQNAENGKIKGIVLQGGFYETSRPVFYPKVIRSKSGVVGEFPFYKSCFSLQGSFLPTIAQATTGAFLKGWGSSERVVSSGSTLAALTTIAYLFRTTPFDSAKRIGFGFAATWILGKIVKSVLSKVQQLNKKTTGVKELSSIEEFNQAIQGKHSMPLLVNFYSPHCDTCKEFSPGFDQISANSSARFMKINAHNFPELTTRYQISAVPTLLLFNEKGEAKNKATGLEEIKKFLSPPQEEAKEEATA